jgi:hypothetical protein
MNTVDPMISDYWFTKGTKQILIDHIHIDNPSFELVKWIDSFMDSDRMYMTKDEQDSELLAQIKARHIDMFTDAVVKEIDYSKYCNGGTIKSKSVDVWYFINGFTEKEIMFAVNNFNINFDHKVKYREFFDKTNTLPNQKEVALKYIEIGDLDKAIELCKKESFDLSLLDFLDGKITEEKLLNWGVGQVMKQYPKRFAPAEVMAALKERFKL